MIIRLGSWVGDELHTGRGAVYSVRVLQIPTPRWTSCDAKVFSVDIPEGEPACIQERAYASPIRYSPGDKHQS